MLVIQCFPLQNSKILEVWFMSAFHSRSKMLNLMSMEAFVCFVFIFSFPLDKLILIFADRWHDAHRFDCVYCEICRKLCNFLKLWGESWHSGLDGCVLNSTELGCYKGLDAYLYKSQGYCKCCIVWVPL